MLSRNPAHFSPAEALAQYEMITSWFIKNKLFPNVVNSVRKAYRVLSDKGLRDLYFKFGRYGIRRSVYNWAELSGDAHIVNSLFPKMYWEVKRAVSPSTSESSAVAIGGSQTDPALYSSDSSSHSDSGVDVSVESENIQSGSLEEDILNIKQELGDTFEELARTDVLCWDSDLHVHSPEHPDHPFVVADLGDVSYVRRKTEN